MYIEEINRVLDSQISFGVIDEKFKQDYLEKYIIQEDIILMDLVIIMNMMRMVIE